MIIRIKVKPRSRTSELAQGPDGIWTARLSSPPIDGKANAELIALVAAHFKLRKSAVTIKSGASGRLKIVQLAE